MISRVRLCPAPGEGTVFAPRLAREFPSVTRLAWEIPRELSISVGFWRNPELHFWAFDRCVDDFVAAGAEAVAVHGPGEDLEEAAIQILTRCQRRIGRRNAASRRASFDRLLEEHRRLHELSRPLVRADFDHAHDTWQWVLRLEADASLPLQAAALFHDVERLASEAEVRVEHVAPDYDAFKRAHAAAGAALAARAFVRAGVPRSETARACDLIARHERPDGDPELAVLNDADALSFFSFNSAGFLDYFGEEHTRRKIVYTLGRLRPQFHRYLDGLRLSPDVGSLLAEARRAGPPAEAVPVDAVPA